MKNLFSTIIALIILISSCGETSEINESKVLLNFNHHCDNIALSDDLLVIQMKLEKIIMF